MDVSRFYDNCEGTWPKDENEYNKGQLWKEKRLESEREESDPVSGDWRKFMYPKEKG